jgi:hypothetical protein
MKRLSACKAAVLVLAVCVLPAVGEPVNPNSDFNAVEKNIEEMTRQARIPLLECSARVLPISDSGKLDDMTISVFKNKDSYFAKIVHLVESRRSTDYHAVSYSQNSVRAGLTPKTDPYNEALKLNDAELLTIHAMSLTRAPETKGHFSVDFDLDKVRSAQVFQLGEATRFGSASLVAAKDANGAALGTFLGGFVVAMCK